MIIVEQSLNVALPISDRAVFMEKGADPLRGPGRRSWPTRDDLARAVFLGALTMPACSPSTSPGRSSSRAR